MATKKTSVKDLRPIKDAMGGASGPKKHSVKSTQSKSGKTFEDGNRRSGKHLL